MKVIIDLENQVVGKNLMQHIQTKIDTIRELLQVDCQIEIINYKTKQDTLIEMKIMGMLDIALAQILFTCEEISKNENPDHASLKPPKYDC